MSQARNLRERSPSNVPVLNPHFQADEPRSSTNTRMAVDDQLLTPTEAAKLLSVCVKTIYNLVRRGLLPVVRLTPSAPRFRMSDLRAFIQKQTYKVAA